MTAFQLDKPVDAAFNMINSFRHLPSQEKAIAHLDCMYDAVVKGGIYVLGLHLSPLSGETCDEESWKATKDELSIVSSLWLVERNLENRFEEFAMSYEVKTPDKQFEIKEKLKFRTYTARQFEDLIDASRFEIEAIHDFQYDIDYSFFLNETVEDAVFVLRAV